MSRQENSGPAAAPCLSAARALAEGLLAAGAARRAGIVVGVAMGLLRLGLHVFVVLLGVQEQPAHALAKDGVRDPPGQL